MHLDPNAFLAEPELIASLEEHATPVLCAEERVLFRQGEPSTGIYILRKGAITLTMVSQQGEELVAVKAKPGSLLGVPGTIGDSPYSLTAVAHAGAETHFLDREKFSRLMTTNPSLSLKVLQLLAAEVRTARQAILDE